MLLSLLPLALASTPGLPTPRPPCGTPATAPLFGPRPNLPVAPPDHEGEKDDRDAYGELPNDEEGENFVVKWGNTGSVDPAAVDALLAAFENAWAVEIGEMGNPAPPGTDAYLFNVYIGDTGDGAPAGYGTAGYYNRDADGYPMIVVSAETLADEAWAKGTATHEFFHAIQDGTGRYAYSGDSAWYWEATAMWMEGEVLPDQDDYVTFLFGYALLPELPVHFFDYPDTGALQEYHQYGAMIFPRYVSEIAADRQVVRDSWTEDLGADTPQEALALLLAERGVDFEDAFGDFAARNATWDYADGALYDQWVDWYGDYYRSQDHRVVAEVERQGTDGLVAAPEDTLPGRYAYNVVTLNRPDDADLTVRFESAAQGSKGTASAWRVTVVRERDAGGPEYVPVPLVDGVGSVRLEAIGDERIHLVAAAVPAEARPNETFAWSYALAPVVVDTPAEDPPPATLPPQADPEPVAFTTCGCASGGADGRLAGLAALAGLVAVGRRRRA